MSRWFRVYDDLVDDPKVQRLPGDMVKALLNLWCLASQNDGRLPAADDIAFKLRMTPSKVNKLLSMLGECGLIDSDEDGLRPHNWNARQYKSDVVDPTAASRQKAYRERNKSRNGDRNATVTVTDTRTYTEQITDTEQIPAPAGSTKRYAFEDGIIKLNQKDLDAWSRAYSNLDLAAELLSLSRWAESEGPNWFHAVKGALAKRNREVKAAKDRPPPAKGEQRWLDGIEGVI